MDLQGLTGRGEQHTNIPFSLGFQSNYTILHKVKFSIAIETRLTPVLPDSKRLSYIGEQVERRVVVPTIGSKERATMPTLGKATKHKTPNPEQRQLHTPATTPKAVGRAPVCHNGGEEDGRVGVSRREQLGR